MSAVTKTKEKSKGEDLELADKDEPKITLPPRSLPIASRGVKTGRDFANLMSALMSDLIDGRVTPNVGNATCNAGGKLLKVVEMQYKYGTSGTGDTPKTLLLAVQSDDDDPKR